MATPQFRCHAAPSALQLLAPSSGATSERKGVMWQRSASPMFASVSLSGLSNALGQPGADGKSRKESNTHVEYPLEFCFKHKPCPSLLGLGVRSKRILGIKVNVYALGLYVDSHAAKKALGHKFGHKGADAKALASDQALFDSLVADNTIEKSMRLVISFGSLTRARFLEALEERLAPALKKAGHEEDLKAFKHQFDDVQFSKGTEVVFVQSGPQLVTQVGGKELGRLSSPQLSRALWDIYLGPQPVSADAKATLGTSLAQVLTS